LRASRSRGFRGTGRERSPRLEAPCERSQAEGLPECSRWSVVGGGRLPEPDAKTPSGILRGCQKRCPCAAGLLSPGLE
jgi:hypothetical protein